MFHHNYIRTELLRPEADGTQPSTTDMEDEAETPENEQQMYSPMTEKDAIAAYYFRKLQIQWMVHSCRLDYCKKNGPCRFFFPFTEEVQEQQYDSRIERMVHLRRHLEDDAYVSSQCGFAGAGASV